MRYGVVEYKIDKLDDKVKNEKVLKLIEANSGIINIFRSRRDKIISHNLRHKKISWVNKVDKKNILGLVEGDRNIMNTIRRHRDKMIGYPLKHNTFKKNIINGNTVQYFDV